MCERGNRDQLVVATKYTGAYQGYQSGMKGNMVNCAGNSKPEFGDECVGFAVQAAD